MKLVVLSFVPAVLGALTTPAPESAEETVGLFGVPPVSSASVQCAGECQGDQEAQSTGLSALIRDVLGNDVSSSVDNHINLAGTPVAEMLYNYLNPANAEPASDYDAPADSPADTRAGGPINHIVSAFLKPASSPSDQPSANEAAEAIARDENDRESDAPDDAEANDEFDVNSWVDRVDSAAHRLVTNVEGIIVQFLPTSAEAVESVEELAAATNLAEKQQEEEEEVPSLTHWYDI
ncbi:hypothetical protein GGF46_001949 [Coemansia sp. RSA 552]|nr:hypothetical protein GGF46_001949 [Coemansia sp. RSA 552]